MADVTISSLPLGTSSRSSELPFSDGLNTSKITITQIADLIVPIGSIIMWSGSIATIPGNWALCNGTNGTVDLRDRFIVGAGRDYAVSNTGGLSAVKLTTEQMPSHTHSVPSGGAGTQGTWGSGGGYATTNSQTTGSRGGDQEHENRPPYYALAFIQRIS